MKQLILYAGLLVAVTALRVPVALAVEIEAFEFNDPTGTLLANAANTGNGGIGVWIEDPGMLPSDIRGGAYNIVKSSLILESNYFQITNITSDTYYLVARMSGWSFQNFDTNEREEIRLAFLNDDDANFGSTITAQMSIRRNLAGGIELFGDALGAGSANIPVAAPLAENQTQPFTAVLELNKTSNAFKVYYKDGNNSTQVLGLGAVAPTRDGNSVRMAANNSFGDGSLDYPIEFVEVFSVDRIAVADTNPFTDLITLEIDRTSGAMTLRNTSGADVSGIESYSITSAAGSMNPTGWDPISSNTTAATNEELAESLSPATNFSNGQNIGLSMSPGAWLKSPFEDVHMVLNLSGGALRTVNATFIGNGGVKWAPGDLNFDNAITGADWLTFIQNAETNLSDVSRAEAYQRGDLNSDGANNIADFIQFKTLYDAANGAGAFVQMLATVPEPSAFILFASTATVVVLRRAKRWGRSPLRLVVAMIPILLATPAAHATILQEFMFNDPDDTPLDNTENSASPGNTWVLGGNSWDPSVVLNGNFRITKTSTGLATAHIDIANVTSGKVWLVAEIAGWNYTATPSSTSEQVRFAFLDNDNMPPSGSTITAQMDIRRSESALQLVGIGALGTGASNIAGSYALPLVRSDPFTMVLELNKDLNQYSVHYKDGNSPFALLGTGNVGLKLDGSVPREGNSIRFAPTGQFNDTGEFFDVNRIYLTDISPLEGPVEPVALSLRVVANGQVSIFNDTDNPVSFNSYRIASATSALNFAGWTSLSDQGLNPVDGTDPGTIPGDGVGETWDEAGGSGDAVLAESFLLGSTTLAPMDSVSLGTAFNPTGLHDVTFSYLDATSGAIVAGSVEYAVTPGVTGDYNNNGTVDAADYVVWRKNVNTMNVLPNDDIGGTIGQSQYDQWRAHFGQSAGNGASASANAAIPEPATWLLLFLAVIGCTLRRYGV